MKNQGFSLVIICIITLLPLISFAQNVGIGILAPVGKLHIKGMEDVSQLIIDANSTQGNMSPLIRLRNSSSLDLLWFNSDHPNNIFIGVSAGSVNNSGGGGNDNIFIGKETGYSNTIGANNTVVGYQSLFSNTEGTYNTAIGVGGLHNNTNGNNNTSIGGDALYSNTTASQNVAVGYSALQNQSFSNNGNVWSSNNVAIGYAALFYNQPSSGVTGISNTAIGSYALYNNITGRNNTAVGRSSLIANNTGNENTSIGILSLEHNTIGNNNTAIGGYALSNNVAGNNGVAIGYFSQTRVNDINTIWENTNTSIGYLSLHGSPTPANNTGLYNTAIGRESLQNNSTGSNNTATGYQALLFNTLGSSNTATGYQALITNTTGIQNTVIGMNADVLSNNLTNATAIGYNAKVGASNCVVLGGTGVHKVNVGIGTTMPLSLLSLESNSVIKTEISINNTSLGGERYLLISVGNFLTGRTGNFEIWKADNSTNMFTIQPGGRIGMGTTIPISQLHLDNSANIGPQITLSAPGGGTPGIAFRPFQGSVDWVTAAQALITATDNNYSANINFSTKTPGAIGNSIVQRMVIQNDGNVGIGNPNPTSLLGLQSNNTGQTTLEIKNTSAGGFGYVLQSVGSGNAGRIGNFEIWRSDGINMLTIQPGGNVGIGTTSPSQLLTVFNGTTTGTYTITGWMSSSDSRLKTNIKPLESSLDKIMKLQGVNYNWIANPKVNNQIGFIAQDVEKIFPEVISIDKDGNYSMAPQNLTAPIIEAIKEQQEHINSLENSINKLEAIIGKMQSTIVCLQNENSALNSQHQ